MKLSFVCFLMLMVGWAVAEDTADRSRQDCADDNLCFIKVPGTQCADGTQSGFSVMYRKNAKFLFLYLDGGGACWNKETCEKGTAKPLTAVSHYEGAYFNQQGLSGWEDLKNPAVPISSGYHFVRVPYCTGDIHAGNRVADYGTAGKPYVIRHVGYKNLTLVLAEVAKRFPDPDHILFMGTSAGGLGVTWNLHQLRVTYPKNKIFVLNDGGLAFKAPIVNAKTLEQVYASWGADQTSPAHTFWSRGGTNQATAVIEHNQQTYPDVAYGFISSYKDLVMTMFAKMLLAPVFTTAVKKTMISLADDDLSKVSNYKVFYLDDFWHGYAEKDPATVTSKGVKLSDWVTAMLNGSHGWSDVRPDKP